MKYSRYEILYLNSLKSKSLKFKTYTELIKYAPSEFKVSGMRERNVSASKKLIKYFRTADLNEYAVGLHRGKHWLNLPSSLLGEMSPFLFIILSSTKVQYQWNEVVRPPTGIKLYFRCLLLLLLRSIFEFWTFTFN